MEGSFTKENGRRDRGAGGSSAAGLLQPLSSPISGLVDRSLCSEFQLLQAVLEVLWQDAGNLRTAGATFRGCVRLFVSTAPCVSCIWALWQFHLLIPSVRVEVANGE